MCLLGLDKCSVYAYSHVTLLTAHLMTCLLTSISWNKHRCWDGPQSSTPGSSGNTRYISFISLNLPCTTTPDFNTTTVYFCRISRRTHFTLHAFISLKYYQCEVISSCKWSHLGANIFSTWEKSWIAIYVFSNMLPWGRQAVFTYSLCEAVAAWPRQHCTPWTRPGSCLMFSSVYEPDNRELERWESVV